MHDDEIKWVEPFLVEYVLVVRENGATEAVLEALAGGDWEAAEIPWEVAECSRRYWADDDSGRRILDAIFRAVPRRLPEMLAG